MKLSEYLNTNNLSAADFAKRIGAKSRATVYRYMSSEDTSKRFPSPKMIGKIAAATGGEVTANDFYPSATKSKKSKHNDNHT